MAHIKDREFYLAPLSYDYSDSYLRMERLRNEDHINNLIAILPEISKLMKLELLPSENDADKVANKIIEKVNSLVK